MTIETEVAALTTATTNLLSAVNVSKATLDTKVADATTQAGTATTQAGTATTQASNAATSAANAEAARAGAVVAQNNAVATVTGGTASLTAAASKIPISAADSTIDPTWLAAFTTHIVVPQNVSPASGGLYVTETPTLTGSAFFPTQGATHTGVQVQICATTAFVTNVYDSGLTAQAATSVVVPAGKIVANTLYYWRIRYQNSLGGLTAWSVPTAFTTRPSFAADVIYTPTATPAEFGDAFEGGFYTGMVWNELTQSTDSKLIATGSLVLTVASMTAAPLVYVGQALEVRSRANPANKMIGTVTAAVGTSLTLDITSVGGSGTFADWSVMAKYRVIVAPKATGQNSSLAYKNANTSSPTACQTVAEGYKATQAMIAAGNAEIYPAAHFCASLKIAGKTDWYLPSRDELELCWRNLKPVTNDNYIVADRYNSGFNYANLGSYDDPDQLHGHNMNSSPVGDAYTLTVPGQVAAGKLFRAGESEAFTFGSSYYWSSSESHSTAAWGQSWHSSSPGYQTSHGYKTPGRVVRAVRRSVI
jgi:hypothetical protein